jgi:hypothetical protein
MSDENLTDVQRITCKIPNGNVGTLLAVTHNLVDRAGSALTPDTVVVETVAYPDESPSNPCCLGGCVRIPSSPEDGTYGLQVRASELNASGEDWIITVQITSMYHHSIQSDDRTAESTEQDGTPFNDCTAL